MSSPHCPRRYAGQQRAPPRPARCERSLPCADGARCEAWLVSRWLYVCRNAFGGHQGCHGSRSPRGGPLIAAPKLLYASSVPDLGGVQGPLAVDRYIVNPLEIAGHTPRPTKSAEPLAGLAVDRHHLHVGAIGDEDVALTGVLRQHEIPNRSVLLRLGFDLKL